MNKDIKMWLTIGIFAVIALIGIYGFYGITGYSISNPETETVDIGIILPLSGGAAYYGEASQRGVEIAAEEIKQVYPEFNFKIYYEDSAFIPKEGVNAYNQLKNSENIDAVITAASHISLAVMPLAKEDRIFQMAIFSSADDYTTSDDFAFRISTRNEVEAERLANLIIDQGIKRLGIIYLNTDFAIILKDNLKEDFIEKKSSVKIIGEESFLLPDNDFRTILTKMKQENPDAIFMVGLASHYAEIMKQSSELGIDVQFISMRSAEDPVLLRNAGELANGLIYTYPFDSTSNSKEVEYFVSTFKTKYGIVPDAYAAEGYEGFKLTALAFVKCGNNSLCVKQYLEDLEGYESVFGNIDFDSNGDVYYDFFPKTVRNGNFVPL